MGHCTPSFVLRCSLAAFAFGNLHSVVGLVMAKEADTVAEGSGEMIRGNRKLNLFDKDGKVQRGCIQSGRVIISRKTPRKLKAEGKSQNKIADIRLQGMDEINKHKVVYESKGEGDFQVVEVGKGNEAAFIQGIMNGPKANLFQYAEEDCLVSPAEDPNDPQFNKQWHHDRMQSSLAWDLETGVEDITIAICDTGVDVDHPDLAANRLEGYHSPSQTWESNGGDITSVHPHGTLCAGCAAARGNNGVGIAGVGWNFKHRPGRVTDRSDGIAFQHNLIDCAKRMCELDDVKVVSLSYGTVESDSRRQAATYCKANGALLVNSAGNDERDLTEYGHADDDDLIVVGASDYYDDKAYFSAYGSYVDLWAPGSAVYTTGPGGTYQQVWGTSYSCPLAAGLIALIWSKNPNLTPDQVETILKESTDTNVGNLDSYGTVYGRINSFQALQLVDALKPTGMPSEYPSSSTMPSESPSSPRPTSKPSVRPSEHPSTSTAPSDNPSSSDSPSSSQHPTSMPSLAPSMIPSVSVLPSVMPSPQPTTGPSRMPSMIPSSKVTREPDRENEVDCTKLPLNLRLLCMKRKREP